jgi:hypothetical protein
VKRRRKTHWLEDADTICWGDLQKAIEMDFRKTFRAKRLDWLV